VPTRPAKVRGASGVPLPMEARQVATLPAGEEWSYEPKWDGFRCIAVREGAGVALISKSGKPLTRYFPEIAAVLAGTRREHFTLDGELCIPVGDVLSFEALQLRLHPAASRVTRLSKETPAVFVLFDLLSLDGVDLRAESLTRRRGRLEKLLATLGGGSSLRLSPQTRSLRRAAAWLAEAGAGSVDGVVAKRLAEPYRSGERAMVKVKRARTADCVVGGFRYGSATRQVASLLLGLFDESGKLHHVGFTSGITDVERAALTRKLEKLRGGPGFSGSAPGGPSRWSTERSGEWVPVRNTLVAEVQYDQVSAHRFRHGTRFLRWRPDKAPRQCLLEQLEPAAGTAAGISVLLGKKSAPGGRPRR
jgi:ATP-dependent DNA ligase